VFFFSFQFPDGTRVASIPGRFRRISPGWRHFFKELLKQQAPVDINVATLKTQFGIPFRRFKMQTPPPRSPPPLSVSLCTGTGSQGFLKSKNLAIICQEKKKAAAGRRWLPPPQGPYFRYALTLGP